MVEFLPIVFHVKYQYSQIDKTNTFYLKTQKTFDGKHTGAADLSGNESVCKTFTVINHNSTVEKKTIYRDLSALLYVCFSAKTMPICFASFTSSP